MIEEIIVRAIKSVVMAVLWQQSGKLLKSVVLMKMLGKH